MFFVIDGNHLACRCWFAKLQNPLSTSYNKNVGMIYLFVNCLKNLIKEYKQYDTNFFVAWDGGGKSKRFEIYPEYKSTRKKLPDEFYEQICDLTEEILPAMNIQQFKQKGIEGDDIVGSVVKQARNLKHRAIIYSGDHDFEQLISNSVLIVKHDKPVDTIKNMEWFKEHYPTLDKPIDLIELMAITGDGSDDIVGVPKVKDVTALKIWNANGKNLQNIIDNCDNLKILDKNGEIVDAKDKLKLSVKENIEVIKRNKLLVTIDCDLDIEVSTEKKECDFEKLEQIFKKLEFNAYLSNFETWKKALTLVKEK
jgi:DNA polymerase-1